MGEGWGRTEAEGEDKDDFETRVGQLALALVYRRVGR